MLKSVTSKQRLRRLLSPRSIAFVGGEQIAGPIRACRRAGYEGEIFVVNPWREEIEGIECTPLLELLPYPPDAAVVGLSQDRSIEAVEALSRLGAGGAAVISSGFAELGEEGKARQEKLVLAAGDMPLLGPNGMGLINQFDGAAVWGGFVHVFVDRDQRRPVPIPDTMRTALSSIHSE